jgi:hypothetical protein
MKSCGCPAWKRRFDEGGLIAGFLVCGKSGAYCGYL